MKTGQRGVDLIKSFESLSLKVYKDPIGIPTIGYGSTYDTNGAKITMSHAPITKLQAEGLLRYGLRGFEYVVNNGLTHNVTQNQFDALISLTYNIGGGAFKKSTLLAIEFSEAMDL